MRKFRELEDRRQQSLLPASIEDYVGQEDIVRYVDAIVDELDLSEIEGRYSSLGRPAFNPRVLVKILLYGKMRGIRSSRELSQAARENLRFIYLAHNEKPDFRTISLFRQRFHRELGGLLSETIRLGMECNVIDLKQVSIDGTKIKANANKDRFVDSRELKKELAELEKQLAKSFEEDRAIDEEEDREHGDDDGEPKLSQEYQDKKVLQNKLRTLLDAHRAQGRNRPIEVNTTDPNARRMYDNGTINVCYNAQLAVDASSMMVVGGFACNACNDANQLTPMLEEIAHNVGRDPELVATDKGYRSIKGLVEIERRNIDGYVPQITREASNLTREDFEYDKNTDSYTCSAGNTLNRIYGKGSKHRVYHGDSCLTCELRKKCIKNHETTQFRRLYVLSQKYLADEMRTKTSTERGKEVLKIRSRTVEPVFGVIKENKKLRRFIFRGMSMINSMWRLELAAYNIQKLTKIRMLATA